MKKRDLNYKAEVDTPMVMGSNEEFDLTSL